MIERETIPDCKDGEHCACWSCTGMCCECETETNPWDKEEQ